MFSRSRLLAIGGAAALATLLLTSAAAFGGHRAASPRAAERVPPNPVVPFESLDLALVIGEGELGGF